MPILRAADPSSDLSQGDILQEITLYQTSRNGEAEPIEAPYCLVVSRDCVAANKGYVVVAAVTTLTYLDHAMQRDDTAEARFKKLDAYLTQMRDGGVSPDIFYLGSLGAGQPRLKANLDQLVTVEMPHLDARQQWLQSVRVATLEPAFCHAIPVRLGWAIGRVGYDDDRWYSTEDLEILVTAASALRDQLSQSVHTARLDVQTYFNNDKKKASLSLTLQNHEKALTDHQVKLDRLLVEKARRTTSK